jgi:hypothetical protein
MLFGWNLIPFVYAIWVEPDPPGSQRGRPKPRRAENRRLSRVFLCYLDGTCLGRERESSVAGGGPQSAATVS